MVNVAARNVPPGTIWAFPEHRSQARFCDPVGPVSNAALSVARSLRRLALSIERGEFGAPRDAGIIIAQCIDRMFLDQAERCREN